MTEFSHAGTVIHGTHRPQDVVPALLGKLDELAPARAQWVRADYPVTLVDPERDPFLAVDSLLGRLQDELDALAPKGWFFGNHPDDGADLGFWRTPEEPSIGKLGGWSNNA